MEKRWKTFLGGLKFHRTDSRGNYFVNGKCVNPLADSGKSIGSNVPKQ